MNGLASPYNKGVKSIPAFYSQVIDDVRINLVTVNDLGEILKAFSEGAESSQSDATIKKTRSHLKQLMACAAKKPVNFAEVSRAITKKFDQLVTEKRKHRALSEGLVSAARLQMKQSTPLNESQIKECLSPFPAKQTKKPAVDRLIKTVEKLDKDAQRALFYRLKEQFEPKLPEAGSTMKVAPKYPEPTGARLLEAKAPLKPKKNKTAAANKKRTVLFSA
jgi:hypothetical protein